MHPVYPVISEYRFQMIEEIKPQPKGGRCWKFCKYFVLYVIAALMIAGFITGLLEGIFGH